MSSWTPYPLLHLFVTLGHVQISLSSVLGSPKTRTSFPPWIVSAIISGWGQENQTLRGCSHNHFLSGTGNNFMIFHDCKSLEKKQQHSYNTHRDKGQVLTWPNISTKVGFFLGGGFVKLMHSFFWFSLISPSFFCALGRSDPLKTPIQEISNRTHWTDPSTWASNSSIATYWGVRWDSVPFNFWWILASLISI